jgi:catechol 2,3-dioxygenase-like lactoylglutathione lyase family enzyme
MTSVLVDNQDKALRFYTDVLGFEKKTEVPLGEYRWLTVVSPDDPDGTELVLEPDVHPAAKVFKEALVSDGIPVTSFAVDDVAAEFARLEQLGVRFTQEPVEMGGSVSSGICHAASRTGPCPSQDSRRTGTKLLCSQSISNSS